MKKIFVCSPLRGSNNCQHGKIVGMSKYTIHERYAQILCKAIVAAGCLPLAPHLFFPQFLDDDVPSAREIGCMFSLELLSICQMVIVYDKCCGISDGMAIEIDKAGLLGLPIYATMGVEQKGWEAAIGTVINQILGV